MSASVASPSDRQLVISDWNPINRNSLLGVFTVTLPSGMVIVGCMLHRGSNGSEWIALPGAAQIDREGRPKRAGDGKLLYKTLIRFKSRDVYERFQAPILEELQRLGHI